MKRPGAPVGKKNQGAKLEPTVRSQSPGGIFHDVTPPINKITNRDGKVTRSGPSDGNTRNTNSLIMDSKGVAGPFTPAEFRANTVNRMRGFRQAKPVTAEINKPHRFGKDPTPRQELEPFWQRWSPREPV